MTNGAIVKTRHGIDHLVLAMNDLEAGRDLYARMGFTLTPKALHPWGTANSLAQLQGCFLELLSIEEPKKIEEHRPGLFSFGAFNREFLSRREGFSMLALDSSDARADHAAWRAADLETYAPFDFSRKAKLPDDEEKTVSFSLTFATNPDIPGIAFFTCQQHAPDVFWREKYQQHANTAYSIAAVTIGSLSPAKHLDFLKQFSGCDEVRENGGGYDVVTPRGALRVLPQDDLDHHYGDAIPSVSLPALLAFHVVVDNLDAPRGLLRAGNISFRDDGAQLVVAARDAFGVAIVFEASS